jgi:hypothetical protein
MSDQCPCDLDTCQPCADGCHELCPECSGTDAYPPPVGEAKKEAG